MLNSEETLNPVLFQYGRWTYVGETATPKHIALKHVSKIISELPQRGTLDFAFHSRDIPQDSIFIGMLINDPPLRCALKRQR